MLAEVKTLLDQIEPAYQVVSSRQRQVLDLQLVGQHEKANQQLNLLNDLQLTIQNQRQAVNLKMGRMEDCGNTLNRAARAARILVNDCCHNLHRVARYGSSCTYHRPS